MTLERELIFELLEQRKSKQEILDTVQGMRELDVVMNPKLVDVALKQYESRKKVKNLKKYTKQSIKEFLNKKLEEIENTYPSLLSAKIIQEKGFCSSCNRLSESNQKYSIQINYLDEKNFSPF